jgi:Na+/H+ antiporter NhaC
VWGYLYDRYARAKLLALASLIWGSTTWLNALVPFLAGVIAMHASLQTATVTISISAWFMCAVLFFATAYVVPRDIENLHQILVQRAKELEGDVA